ncbi:MAG: hypothetical protein RL264_260 [Bacteroidota bacterium]|jgi:hypothetical protein
MKNQNEKLMNSRKDEFKKSNNEADMTNRNLGTNWTNITYDKNQGNRGVQISKKKSQNKR